MLSDICLEFLVASEQANTVEAQAEAVDTLDVALQHYVPGLACPHAVLQALNDGIATYRREPHSPRDLINKVEAVHRYYNHGHPPPLRDLLEALETPETVTHPAAGDAVEHRSAGRARTPHKRTGCPGGASDKAARSEADRAIRKAKGN